MWIDNVIIMLNAKIKWRVSKKLTFLIAIVLTALVITGTLSIYTLSVFNGRFEKTLDINIKRVIIASEMNDDLMRFDRLVVEHIRSHYQADRNTIDHELAAINRHFNASIEDLKMLKQDSTNNAILGELEPSWQEYSRTVGKILDKSRRNDAEGALELWDGWASVRYRDIKYLIKQVISYNQQSAQISKNEVNRAFESVRWRIVLIIGVTCIVSVLLGIIIIRYLQISLRNLIMANESISQGNLTQGLEVAVHNSRDEIGELAASSRKVAESIKKMVEDVTGMTDRLLPQDGEADVDVDADADGGDEREFTLIDTEKTSALVQDLNQSLENVKSEIDRMCKSDLVNDGLQEAHQRTLATIDNFNKEIEKLKMAVDSLAQMPEKMDCLIERYGSIDQIAGGLRADEIFKRLLGVAGEIVDTMEVIKYGLLDLKMRLDSRNNATENPEAGSYFLNLAKAIKNIVVRAENIIDKVQLLQNNLNRVSKELKWNALKIKEPIPEANPEINEFQLLLAKLERIMVNFNR